MLYFTFIAFNFFLISFLTAKKIPVEYLLSLNPGKKFQS